MRAEHQQLFADWCTNNRVFRIDTRQLLLEILFTQELIMVAVADVQAALDGLVTDTKNTLADLGQQIAQLNALVTSLQGTAAPDLQPVLDKIAALDATVKAADPSIGAPGASSPSAPSAT